MKSIHALRVIYKQYTRNTDKSQYTYKEYFIILIREVIKMLKIRELREDKDLTQKQLSKLLNCTQQTYSRYETEEITIDINNLKKLAEFYNTSIDYIVGLTNETKPYPRARK